MPRDISTDIYAPGHLVPLWNDLADPIFDDMELKGFKSRTKLLSGKR